MRRIVDFCIVATMLAAMTSCGTARRYEQLPTVEEEMTQQWAGKEYSDIVQAYSAPDRIVPDGKDGSILVYETVSTSMSTSKSLMFDNYSTTVTEDKEYMHFFLNPEGFCYLVKTNQLVDGTARAKASSRFWTTTLITIGAVAVSIPIILSISHERETKHWRSQYWY